MIGLKKIQEFSLPNCLNNEVAHPLWSYSIHYWRKEGVRSVTQCGLNSICPAMGANGFTYPVQIHRIVRDILHASKNEEDLEK